MTTLDPSATPQQRRATANADGHSAFNRLFKPHPPLLQRPLPDLAAAASGPLLALRCSSWHAGGCQQLIDRAVQRLSFAAAAHGVEPVWQGTTVIWTGGPRRSAVFTAVAVLLFPAGTTDAEVVDVVHDAHCHVVDWWAVGVLDVWRTMDRSQARWHVS